MYVSIRGTPGDTLLALVRAAEIGRDREVERLQSESGVGAGTVRALLDGELLPTASDAGTLDAIARAAGIAPQALGYQAAMTRADGDEQGLRFVLSTATSDRYSDIVVQNWDLAGFLLNPVAPWQHNYWAPPVGRWVDVAVNGEGESRALQGTLIFDEDPDHDLALMVARQYREGFLNAVSVGFLPRTRTWRHSLEEGDPLFSKRGAIFDDNVLLEASAVTVPGNGEAVAIGRSMLGARRRTAGPDMRWLQAPAPERSWLW
jgi:hypothetical protein